MQSKHAGWFSTLGALGLLLAGCSAGGGDQGSTFFIESCSLGCSNGASGQQINCGVVGVAENQEIALLFTSAVDVGSVNKESFQVNHSITGEAASGTRFVDPLNPNRLIFRPKLSVGPTGQTIFGFQQGSSYVVRLDGVVQKDDGPFVSNSGGRQNEARVNCTITANQPIVDPIDGKPRVSMVAEVVDPGSGQSSLVTVVQGQTPGAVNVKTFSVATFLFDELMNIATLVDPSTGTSPTISVVVDIDGNTNTVQDRAPVEGTFVYGLDQVAQTTTVVFTPTSGFPSAGANPSVPRLILLTVGNGASDIAGNTVENPGTFNFVPQAISFPAVTLPNGGEQFTDTIYEDPEISGADWGTATAGRLTPGEGGGSGRLGRLHVAAGETRVLHASPSTATATLKFNNSPIQNDAVVLGGVTFTFKTAPAGALQLPIQGSLGFTVSSLVDKVNDYILNTATPGSPITLAKLTQADHNLILFEAVTAGPMLVPFGIEVVEIPQTPPPVLPLAEASSAILLGGFDYDSFGSPRIITNFNFDPATGGTLGGIPPEIVVTDGIYEFTDLVIETTGQLILAGDKPVQLLVRGDFVLQAQGIIDISGGSPGVHNSSAPYGQPGGAPGNGAGGGGRGGDRSNSPGLVSVGGATLANSNLNGSPGLGVGGLASVGEGLGGVHWPSNYPTNPTDYQQWTFATVPCSSEQYGHTGSGGAYALDGVRGLAKSPKATGTNSAMAQTPNLPPGQTLGGSLIQVGIEPPSANPTAERLLTPSLGYLRGGSGGGGGGGHLAGVTTIAFTSCFDGILGFDSFNDNSAAGGGGGGGAAQIQAGGALVLDGVIDAGGGFGGSHNGNFGVGARAQPGGGGSGGSVLLQGGELLLSNSPARILVDGGSAGVGGDLFVTSKGGEGSPGVARVEQRGLGNGPDATTVAAITFPTDPMDPTSVNWLSTGDWIYDNSKVTPGEAVNGSQSCWMQVLGSFFSLTFQSDAVSPAAPADMGWNMDVILDLGGGEMTYPYRGTDGNGPFLGLYPEEHWGNLLNRDLQLGEVSAPIVVRFQGAASKAALSDICDVDEDSPDGPLKVGSLSPWVNHPAELNPYLPLPTIARFVILFDRSHPDFSMVKGITNLRIEAQPE